MHPIAQFIDQLNEQGLWEKQLHINRNEYLTVRGNRDTNLYFILNGSVRVYVDDGFEEQIIRLAYRQNIVAALDSFLSGNPTDFYIQAIKRSTLNVISREAFLRFVHSSPEHILVWNSILQEAVLQSLEREKDILTISPRERYNRVLKRSPQLFQEIPLKYIASYLRMSPETLSRIKKS